MNKNKKIFVVVLLVIIGLSAIVLAIWNNKKDNSNGNFNDNAQVVKKENFVEKTSFEERENIIKGLLIAKHQLSENTDVFIARESTTHMSGIFVSSASENKPGSQGKFFATVGESASIVWSGEGDIDCSILKSYEFPQEMIPACF